MVVWKRNRATDREWKKESGEANIGIGGVLGTVLNLGARISSEASTREIMRTKVTPRISDLFEGIDVLARDVEQKTNKPLLCIVEDLDKIDPTKAEEIFYQNGKSVSDPEVAIIYTFPVALHHSNEYTQIADYFDFGYTLPNFKLENRDAIKSILLQRLEANLLSPKATDLLIDYSGGVPRSIIRLARAACLKARVDGSTQIDVHHVHDAIAKERNDFDRMLSKGQREALQKVVETQVIDQTDEYRDLLHNLSILEYKNGDLWHDVNPIVRDLLK